MKEKYTPTVKGKASICHWNLQFRFYTKDQCKKFIKLLMKENVNYHYEYWYVMGDSSNPSEYWISIKDQPWANNLVRIAKILQKVDYEFE